MTSRLAVAQSTDGLPTIVNVTVDAGTGWSEWIAVGLTFALVVVTVWYARNTHGMVHEMKVSRAADNAARRYQKAEMAAQRMLGPLQELSDLMHAKSPTAVEPSRFHDAHTALEADRYLLDDPIVSKRIAACATVLGVASLENQEMRSRGLSAGAVLVATREVVTATRRIVEDFVAERTPERDHWDRGGGDRFPEPTNTFAWISDIGRSGL